MEFGDWLAGELKDKEFAAAFAEFDIIVRERWRILERRVKALEERMAELERVRYQSFRPPNGLPADTVSPPYCDSYTSTELDWEIQTYN